jgi:hypothetical protein
MDLRWVAVEMDGAAIPRPGLHWVNGLNGAGTVFHIFADVNFQGSWEMLLGFWSKEEGNRIRIALQGISLRQASTHAAGYSRMHWTSRILALREFGDSVRDTTGLRWGRASGVQRRRGGRRCVGISAWAAARSEPSHVFRFCVCEM